MKVIVLHNGKIFHQGDANDSINNYSKIISYNIIDQKDSPNELLIRMMILITESKVKNYNLVNITTVEKMLKLKIVNYLTIMELKQPSYILAHFAVSFKVKAYDKILDPIYALTIKIVRVSKFMVKTPSLLKFHFKS